MTRLAGHDLRALQITLGALVSWKHGRVEIVVLCCNLLQRVAKHTVEQPLVRSIVYLLCRIAFRHPVPGIRTRLDPLNLRTINKLHSFIQDGDEEFISDLTSFFAYVSWSEESKGHILRAILRAPNSGLSPSSQTAIITMLGTARWSLVERFDHGELIKFVGGLPTDMVVERIVDDRSVCIGLMRLLLFITFHPPPKTDTQPFWRILLHIPPRAPHLFSRDLQDYPGHTDPVQVSLASFSSSSGSEEHRKREETLWMRLFWSSRFFEMDCGSWSKFRAETDGLTQRRPALLRQLMSLCFGLEGEAQVSPDSATARTKAYMEMFKLRGRVLQSTTAGNSWPGPDAFAARPTTRTRRQNSVLSQIQDSSPPPPTTSTGPSVSLPQPQLPSQKRSEPPTPTRVIGDVNQPVPVQSNPGFGEPPDPLAVTPRDTPPASPTMRRQNSISSQIQDSSPPLPTTSTGPTVSLPQPPPSSQERSELPIQVTDGGNQQPVSFQSGPGSGKPPGPLVVAPIDTPPAGPTTRRQNSTSSKIQDSLLPPPSTSTGPAVSLPQPSPPSQERSKPPTRVIDDGNQQPIPVRSGPGSGKPPGPLAVAPIDTPPAGPTARRRNSISSKIQDSLLPPPSTSTGPAVSPPQPPSPSQERLESPIPVVDDGNQQLVSFQSGPGSGEPPGPLVVAPIDTPPAGPATRRQNSILSEIQDDLPPPPTTSTGPAASSSRSPQARSEPPTRVIDDGNQQPLPVQSGPGSSEPPDAGPRSVHPPIAPLHASDEAGSSSGLPLPANNEEDGLH